MFEYACGHIKGKFSHKYGLSGKAQMSTHYWGFFF